MDWLSRLFEMMPVRGRLNLRCFYGAPWRIDQGPAEAGAIPYHAVLGGSALLQDPAGGRPLHLKVGDVLLLTDNPRHVLNDGSGARPKPATNRQSLNLLVSENAGKGERLDMLCGHFVIAPPHDRLLRNYLPPKLVVHTGADGGETVQSGTAAQLTGLVALMRSESESDHLGGRAMLNALYRTAEQLGVDVLYDAEVKNLEIDNGMFLGAELKYNGAHVTARASALVAAAGGFEANIEWLRQYWGEAADNFLIRGTPYNRGSVLKMLLDKGVKEIGDPTQCHAVAIDARAPKFDGGIITRHDSVVFGIVVNKHAQRFYDEGEDIWPKRYAIWGRLVAAQPDQIAYIIFDSSVVTSFMPTLFPPIAGATLAELAQKLTLDPAALEKTVADFNAAVRPGTFDHTILDDCRTEGITPAKTHWARKIDAPPYLAYPVRPGITFTYLGTRVNKQSRMLMKDGKPSANMFAAGEIMAGNVLGKGYAAGMGMTIGSVFGRIAGREAAKNARN